VAPLARPVHTLAAVLQGKLLFPAGPAALALIQLAAATVVLAISAPSDASSGIKWVRGTEPSLHPATFVTSSNSSREPLVQNAADSAGDPGLTGPVPRLGGV
jgi:hypothetical protein